MAVIFLCQGSNGNCKINFHENYDYIKIWQNLLISFYPQARASTSKYGKFIVNNLRN